MFTGLIEQLGTVADRSPTPAGVRLLIDPGSWGYRPDVGASIAIDGCCLTVAADPVETRGMLAFDAIPETLSKTTLGRLKPGSRVHLEHAATASTLLGGHIVQGHVDGVGRVVGVQSAGEWRIRFVPPGDLMQYLAPKGSVCVQGVSLTIAAVEPREAGPGGEVGWFEVALIPTTLAKTTLGELRVGDEVNLECDVMAKTAVHWLRHFSGRVAGGVGGV